MAIRPERTSGRRRSKSHGRPVVLRPVDAFMLGTGSGLGAAAMAFPTIALGPLEHEFGAPGTEILAAAGAAPVALVLVLNRLIRRGGMISRRKVVGLWWLAALGLVLFAIPPVGRIGGSLALTIVSMAMVGCGVAAGYHVQANKLTGPARFDPGPGRRVGHAAGLAQRWTLITGIALPVISAVAIERMGTRAATIGLGLVVVVFALANSRWHGMPDARPGVGQASVWALVRQTPEVSRDAVGSFVLYGAWGALYPIVALLGATPVDQAWVTVIARGAAAGFVAWLGLLADRDRQRVVRLAAACAAAGVVLLVTFRGLASWTPAAGGVAMAETGYNGIAGALKQSLARGEDPVRRTQTGFLFRFAGFGAVPLAIDGLWAVLSGHSVLVAARLVVAMCLIILLVLVLAIVPRVVRRDGGHPIKAPGIGTIYLTVLSPVGRDPRLWLHVYVDGSHLYRWTDDRNRPRNPGMTFFELRPGGRLVVVDRTSHTRLLEFRSHRSKEKPAGRQGSGRHARRDASIAAMRSSRYPGDGLRITARGAQGGAGWIVGTLERLTTRPVNVEVRQHSADDLPLPLRISLLEAPRPLGWSATRPEDVVTYTVRSEAFGTPSKKVDLRVNSLVFAHDRC